MQTAHPLLVASLLAGLVYAQQEPPPPDPTVEEPEPSPQDPVTADKVIVTASRAPQDPLEAPYSVDRVGFEDVVREGYRTTPQALREIPGVMVQETSFGQGSPYIRGFTSFRNLFLIDGVRLNNSVFRPGPNQYWNTVDPYSLDRLELVKGPSSVLYGSDAIGGTVNAITRSPWKYAEEEGVAYGGSTYLRYASAENAVAGRGEVSIGYTWEDGSRTGLLVGGSAKNFDDLEGGADTGLQPNTGYGENDFDVKIEHWLDADTRIVFLHQQVHLDDVPRTHRTVEGISWRGTTVGSDLRHDFDQDRRLTYLQYHRENIGGFVDAFRANLSWHVQEEVRDRIRGSGSQSNSGFEVGTLGAWFLFESPSEIGRWTYGVEYYRDFVDSFARPGSGIQGPVADDATYDLLGVFAQDVVELAERWELTLGGRFNYAAANADSVEDPGTGSRIEVTDDWSDVVGSARLRYEVVPEEVSLFAGVSQGFRAPNLSDLTRFDVARSGELEIPAPGLDAEEYVSYELGAKTRTADTEVQGSVFYTDVSDQILRFPTGATGPGGETIVTKANVGDGYFYGVELAAAHRFLPEWTAFGAGTWLTGRIDNFESGMNLVEEYPSRLMPLTVQVGVRWEEELGRFWAESALVITDDADKLSASDTRDTQRIPPGGTPGYLLWHLRAGWQITDETSLDVALDNVTDVDYRVHGSGSNGPGMNLIVGFRTVF